MHRSLLVAVALLLLPLGCASFSSTAADAGGEERVDGDAGAPEAGPTVDAGPRCDGGACGGTCTFQGRTFAVGESFVSATTCNSCNCLDDGNVGCGQVLFTCANGDEQVEVGDSVVVDGGCGTCACDLEQGGARFEVGPCEGTCGATACE